MKKIFILVLMLFIMGCYPATQSTTNTTLETSSVTDTTCNANSIIEAPSLSNTQEGLIEWASIENASGYTIFVIDNTMIDSELLLQNQEFTLSAETLVFDTSVLEANRSYEIYALAQNDGYCDAEESNILVLDLFEDLGSLEVNYNLNNLNNFYFYEQVFPEFYYLFAYGNKVENTNYEIVDGRLFINHDFLILYYNLSLGFAAKIYTGSGVYNITFNFEDELMPGILSANEVEFSNEDLEFVFDYCGGDLADLYGNDILVSDYTLVDNVLTINADFIQNLFSTDLDRDTIILGYQLRNDTDIVIGYLFISRQ